MPFHPEAERLAKAFIQTFWAADHEIQWGNIEKEYALWLDDSTVVVGKLDADGVTAGGTPFFADWKTASKGKARFMVSEKAKWRMSPQALTYGLFKGGDCKTFLVRWVLKTDPASTDFEWYSYEQGELDAWREQLKLVASKIRHSRAHTGSGKKGPWETNFENCLRYGVNYPCAFYEHGCPKQNFNFVPLGMVAKTSSHIGLEDEINKEHGHNKNLVILGQSRVKDWFYCNEYYRRMHENALMNEDSEPLEIGTDFHAIIAAHILNIKKEQAK